MKKRDRKKALQVMMNANLEDYIRFINRVVSQQNQLGREV